MLGGGPNFFNLSLAASTSCLNCVPPSLINRASSAFLCALLPFGAGNSSASEGIVSSPELSSPLFPTGDGSGESLSEPESFFLNAPAISFTAAVAPATAPVPSPTAAAIPAFANLTSPFAAFTIGAVPVTIPFAVCKPFAIF